MAAGQLDSVGKFLRRLANQDLAEHASDSDLLASFLGRRDEAAFLTLLHRHGPLVLGVSQRVLGNTADAEDAFQATFLIFLRNARSIAKQGSLSSWLHGVAHRVAVRAKTNGARRRLVEQQAPARLASDALLEAVWQDLRPFWTWKSLGFPRFAGWHSCSVTCKANLMRRRPGCSAVRSGRFNRAFPGRARY